MVMTQKEYIKKLRCRLAFVVSEKELADIVSDMEEVFSDGIADGKSEEQICLSLGSPKEAARNILSERGVKLSAGGGLIKGAAFAFITAAAMWFLFTDFNKSVYFMPFVPLGLLLLMGNGRLSSLTEKKASIWGVASCLIPLGNIPLFSRLADAVILSEEEVLFPLGAAIALVTAASLACGVLSVRKAPYGVKAPALVGAASLCIAVLQSYSAFKIAGQTGADSRAEQIAFRAPYVNLFSLTLFISGGIIFVLSAFRLDRASLPCMYAVLGALMIFSRERYVLVRLDITAEFEPILKYVHEPLWAEVSAMTALAVIINIFLIIRRAKKNG